MRSAVTNRRRPRPAAALLALVLALLGVGPGAAQTLVDPGTVIQTIDASLWSPPAPDTAGITYRPDTGELLTCDSEVEEMAIFAGVNLWTHTRTGVVTGTASTTAFSNEPTGVVWDPGGGRLWIADDNERTIFEIDFGPDGAWNTADDVIVPLEDYDEEGCTDLEDVAWDNVHGHLYVSSGASQRICRIEPGQNGVFDGAPPSGDDVVTTYDTGGYGIDDPEGIVYDPFWDTLVVADRSSRDLYELTRDGGYLRRIDVDFPSGSRPSGVTIAPGSTNPLLRNYWVTDRRTDNGGNPDENDGRIYEVVAIPLGGNGAPIVDAGPAQAVVWPENSVQLSGFVSDDGHPVPPSAFASLWSKLSGPGSVSFASASSPSTTATFSEPGSYVLQLEGDDSEAQTVDTVSIILDDTVTLSATTVGPGSLALDPPGGSYVYGQSVTLTAIPAAGAGFAGWSGDLAGTTSPQPLLMDGDKLVTATFAPLHEVDVNVSGPGSVTLDPPSGSYVAGTLVTVTATPGADAVFDGFTGDLAGTASPQLLTVDADKAIGASFTQHYRIGVSMSGPGTVTLDPPVGPYAPGSVVTVTATPDAGAVFDGFTGDLAGTASPQLLTVDADKTITASFTQHHTVSVNATGPGTVALDPPVGPYAPGTVVTVTATPGADAVFDGFTGDLTGTASPQLLTVDADKAIGASFTQHFTVSVNATGPGAVTLDPPGESFAAGSVVTVTATPDAGAVFDGFTGDLAGTASPQLLTVDADKTIGASFTQQYTVSVNATGPGTVTLDPPVGPYAPGTVVTVTATPDAGAVFDGFTGDLAGSASPQLLIVDADKTVGAGFSASYALDVSTGVGGTVSVDPPGGPYPAGSIVTLTAVPTGGNYVFGAWSGDATGSDNPLFLLMDGDKSVHASFPSSGTSGGGGSACGIGPELAAALPLLAWLHGRRRRLR